jgi:Holliday junction resolvase
LGKIVTIYLSDDEARDLKEFCDESRCTQYSVLKTAVRQLLYRPVQVEEEGPQEIVEEPEETLEDTEEESTTIEEARARETRLRCYYGRAS